MNALLFFLSLSFFAAADPTCDLELKKISPVDLPHHRQDADLNGDGLKDIFYLMGHEKFFLTCVFLAEKSNAVEGQYSLRHSHKGFYDSVLNLDNSGTPHFIVASDNLERPCGPTPTKYIPEELKSEVRMLYKKWERPFEKFNYQYSNPDFYPIHNLFLQNDVTIYTFKGNAKMDVTKEARSYLDLKKRVLTETINNKETPVLCRRLMEANLKRISSL